MITTGDDYNDLAGLLPAAEQSFTNRTRYSYLVYLPLVGRWDYVFHHWLGFQEAGVAGGERADWYGLDQYLYYALNDCWKAGFRAEWFRDEEGTRVGLNRPSNPNNPPFVGDFYSLGFGLNWNPTNNLALRPEIRADFFDGVGAPYADGNRDTQALLGIDGIVKF
jgi:hypothetical protein